MVSITDALHQVQQDLGELLSESFVHKVAAQLGHHWRNRRLNPVTTIHLLILQILYRNTAYSHLPRISGIDFTAGAFCQAKRRLPTALLAALLEQVWQRVGRALGEDGRWKGHRTFLIDGTSCSMPDTPSLQAAYGQPSGQKKGCGFPMGKLLMLFDASTGMVRRFLAGPCITGELSSTPRLHRVLCRGDLLIGDRGFCSYVHLALLMRRGLHALLRLHESQIVSFKLHRPHARGHDNQVDKGRPRSRWIRRLGEGDQIVEYLKPQHRPRWCRVRRYASLPVCLRLRELRYRVAQAGFRTRQVTLVTTLLDPVAYPKEELAKLYLVRWRVENNFRDLKCTLGMATLKGQGPAMIEREMLAFVLVYNLVRLVMYAAAEKQAVAVDRISFVDAVRWLAHARPGTALPRLIVNPLRPGRFEPRVVKRRHNGYSVMTRPRAALQRRLRRGLSIGCR